MRLSINGMTGLHEAGIFRLPGSHRRIQDLQDKFDSPENYGLDIDWTPYTVQDAADVLRRYLTRLPEPVIPLQFYDQFRAAGRQHHNYEGNSGTTADPDVKTVTLYEELLHQLPVANRHLVVYLLDFLALFAANSDKNLMPASSLAAVFHPGFLSRSDEGLDLEEHKLSQDVLEFLILNQRHLALDPILAD